MKKQILSIAILAALPFGAWADNPVVSVGPATVPSNETAIVATANPPYQTLIPSNDDKQHIASTAYVKGAYNDAIAAVNKIDSTKQDKLLSKNINSPLSTDVESYDSAATAITRVVTDGIVNPKNYDGSLMTMGAVLRTVRAAVNKSTDIATSLINAKSVKVYTTWDNDTDNATQLVSFADVPTE